MENKNKGIETPAKKSRKTAKKSNKSGDKTPIIKEKNKTKKNTAPPRRSRSDSLDVALLIAQGAGRVIDPPTNVRMQEKDLSFFNSIIDEFADIEWSDHQIELAAVLARTMCQLEEEQFKLIVEGLMIETKSKKGNSYYSINPRKAGVQMCANTVLSLRRSLSLHARARAGEGRDIGKRRAAAKKIESDINDIDDTDGLIPRRSPTVQ